MLVQVKDLQFLDTEACYWQLALQNSMQYRAHSKAGIPHLGLSHAHLVHEQPLHA